MSKKFVYLFSEGNGSMRELLGGKGANLAEMTNLGMPVPQGFTITTEACTQYYQDGRTINAEIQDEIMAYMAKLEDMTGKKFGDMNNPLLVSVRSGARASMPGMMDTILNLGLNDQVVEAFAKKTKNPRFAYDSYRRFIQMYSDVVMEVGKKYFEELIDEMKAKRGVTLDTELTAKDLKELAEQFKAEYREKIGEEFPQDAREQLMGAVRAVFRSWDNPRAIYYRRMNDIPSSWGTAVNVQMMVFGNMGDMEFTIENRKLFMLQTRNGKRTAAAALKIACDLVDEGMITEEEAVTMIDPKSLDSLLHPTFPKEELDRVAPIGQGLAASPGAAAGQVVFTADDVVEWVDKGHKVILVRLETSPEDIEGMHFARGILTVRGGMTSHAAVVARGMGTCCVSGCGDIVIDEANKKFTLNGKEYKEGDWISLDGSTGNIYGERLHTAEAKISGEFERIMNWADKYRALEVRTNADTPKDARQAKNFGAEGIGLCRTEHMFFDTDRIAAIREMIVSETVEQRERALAKIEPMQQKDFEEIYEAMMGKPVTIRLLDPPLHEFLPNDDADIKALAKEMNISEEHLRNTIDSLHEFNPMMGHRGCRLDITYPEIAKMQTAAIIKAALAVRSRRPAWRITPESWHM